ncbi:hypothetical protein ACS5NO_32295 [Larkinella sp. GY13]|uniref:hypothetical protein n=1 Tax=Larkinella sp. GY13 TaxID=3453720 RepID=UPI003EEFB530
MDILSFNPFIGPANKAHAGDIQNGLSTGHANASTTILLIVARLAGVLVLIRLVTDQIPQPD